MTALPLDAPVIGRPVTEVLAASRALVDPALRAAVDTLPGPLRIVSGYHFGWWNERGAAQRTDGGKALRPALVLLSAAAVGGDPADAVPAAVAVELVHNFSLLHDDVMDRDTTRRHRPTAWSVFGVNPAILAGDALLTLAFEVVAGSGHPAAAAGARLLSGAVLDLLNGQSADLSFETRVDVELAECIRMAEGKTGALLAGAATLGARYGGAPPDRAEQLGRFGHEVGLAYQYVDDLLGIWGDPEVTGKPVHSDLVNRKKSLPVVAALGSPTRAGQELAELYGGDVPLTPGELSRAAELIDLAGARGWCQAQADLLLERGLDHLHSADPEPGPAAELTALARLAVRRDH